MIQKPTLKPYGTHWKLTVQTLFRKVIRKIMWKKVELTGLTPVASLEGAALDWAVTLAEYPNTEHDVWRNFRSECHYSTDWAQGGPIIERDIEG
jgi:hypothetical protein